MPETLCYNVHEGNEQCQNGQEINRLLADEFISGHFDRANARERGNQRFPSGALRRLRVRSGHLCHAVCGAHDTMNPSTKETTWKNSKGDVWNRAEEEEKEETEVSFGC